MAMQHALGNCYAYALHGALTSTLIRLPSLPARGLLNDAACL